MRRKQGFLSDADFEERSGMEAEEDTEVLGGFAGGGAREEDFAAEETASTAAVEAKGGSLGAEDERTHTPEDEETHEDEEYEPTRKTRRRKNVVTVEEGRLRISNRYKEIFY